MVDLQHLTQKFPGGSIKFQEISKISRRVFKFQEISRISRSCRHPDSLVPEHWRYNPTANVVNVNWKLHFMRASTGRPRHTWLSKQTFSRSIMAWTQQATRTGQRTLEAARGKGYAPVRGTPVTMMIMMVMKSRTHAVTEQCTWPVTYPQCLVFVNWL